MDFRNLETSDLVYRTCMQGCESVKSVAGGGHKKVVGPQMQRQAVEVMRSEAVVSERRACGLVKIHRATCRYRRRRVENPRLRERLRELAATRRRFGYRRLKILLKREGFAVNHKRVYRLYVEEKLDCGGSEDGGGCRRPPHACPCNYRCAPTRSGPWTSPKMRSPVDASSEL